MQNIIIKIPQYFDIKNFDGVLEQQKILSTRPQKDSQNLIFDFSGTKYTSILGVLLIAHIADELQPLNYKCFAHYGKTKDESLMAWFSRTMGLVKNSPNREIQEYLNTFRVGIQRCINGQQSLDAVNKLIPIIKTELRPSEPVLRALNWAIWELVDNAGIHGYKSSGSFETNYPKPVYFCAFGFKNVIDIAILDSGQGIHNSFISSGIEKYKNITNEKALELSILDKESSNPQGSPGFGLFGCAEIAKQSQGGLVILSSSNKLILSEGNLNILSSSNFNGTMVSLRMPKEVKIDLVKILGKDNVFATEPIENLIGDFNG